MITAGSCFPVVPTFSPEKCVSLEPSQSMESRPNGEWTAQRVDVVQTGEVAGPHVVVLLSQVGRFDPVSILIVIFTENGERWL